MALPIFDLDTLRPAANPAATPERRGRASAPGYALTGATSASAERGTVAR